jgi:hypothetical protein
MNPVFIAKYLNSGGSLIKYQIPGMTFRNAGSSYFYGLKEC